jgi:hypothetical protein
MRRTRFMSLVFLMLALAFFLVPSFRQSFRVLAIDLSRHPWERIGKELAAKKLESFVPVAEQQRDARTLAFVALHLPAGPEAARLADRAVALDPRLTWIYYSFVNVDTYRSGRLPDQWVARFQAWDPANAIPYLLAAERIRLKRGDKWPAPQQVELLEKEAEWRQVMEKAFAAPKYDSYLQQRFDLERAWLLDHHLAQPDILLLSMASYPIPNLLNIREYANLLTQKLGKEAQEAKHAPEALTYYWSTAHFGERMQLHSSSLIEKLIAAAVQKMAYEQLVPLLRETGRRDEAASVEYSQAALQQMIDYYRGQDPSAKSANYLWGALMAFLLSGLTIVFGLLTLLAVVYVNAKRWVRPEKKGRLYRLLTVAENYLPILFFAACAGLYLSYYPFARNFLYYLTASGETHNFEPLFYNVLPAFDIALSGQTLGIGNPFVPYLWYALAGVAVTVVIELLSRRRAASA